MWKRLTAVALALVLSAALILPGSASVLMVNGQNLWQNALARPEGGTTYVSLRVVANVLAPHAEVSWSQGTAWVRGSGVMLKAVPGQTYVTVNDRALYVAKGVKLENGRVMVPIRVLAEALGGTVAWSRTEGITLTVGSGVPGPAPYTSDELYWMSRIISAESQGEPLKGKLAVGTVILNRVASDQFPSTIYDVIFDKKWGVQFSPTINGMIYQEPTAESVLAAKLCLEGARVAGDSLYFLNPEIAENFWIMENREFVMTIGRHWFYR